MTQRLQTIAMAAGIFLLPFLVWPVQNDQDGTFLEPKLWGCFLLGNMCFAFLLSKKTHPTMGIFHLACSISILKSWMNTESLYPFLYLLAAECFALFFVSMEKKNQRSILHALIAGAILVCAHALIQVAGHDPGIVHAPGVRSGVPHGLFHQHTELASFLAPIAVLSFGMGLWIPAALISIALLLTHSLWSIFGCIAGILVHLRAWKALALSMTASLSGLIYCYLSEIHIDRGRYEIWMAGLRAASKQLWFGYGLGSWGTQFPAHFQPRDTWQFGFFDRAHSEPVQALYEGGLLLCVPLAIMCLAACWKIIKKPTYAAGPLICLAVNSCGSFPLQIAPQNLMAMLFLCLTLRGDENEQVA